MGQEDVLNSAGGTPLACGRADPKCVEKHKCPLDEVEGSYLIMHGQFVNDMAQESTSDKLDGKFINACLSEDHWQ